MKQLHISGQFKNRGGIFSMRRLKYFTAAALSAVLALGLTACGKDGQTGGTDKGGTDTGVQKTKISAYISGGDTIDLARTLMDGFNKESGTTEVELVELPNGSTGYQMLTIMYNSGNPPTLFGLEGGDVLKLTDKLMDLSGLEMLKAAADGTTEDVTVDGKVYGVPAKLQGYGLMYSRQVLDETMGEDFDPSTIKTRDDLRKVFETIQSKGVAPVAVSPFDWSLANHYLIQTYSGQAADNAGRDAFMAELKEGKAALADNAVLNDYMDTFDLLMEYNYYQDNPLETVADNVDKQAQLITAGEAAFWFMGNWAAPNIRNLDETGEYAFIPVPINGTDSYNYGKVCTLVPTYYCVETSKTNEAEQKSALELLDYLVNSDAGMQYTIDCGDIPAYSNNTKEIKESLAASIFSYSSQGLNFPMYQKYPSDHFDVLGQPFQKYLDKQIDRGEFIKQIEEYWQKQE